MRIVHVLTSYLVGGGERVALDLASGQRERGHRLLAVALDPDPEGPHAANFRRAGIEALTVARRGPTVDPTLVGRLAWLFRERRIDVVHTHNEQPLIYAGPAAKLVGLPVVHTKHGFNAASARRMLLRRTAARCADVFIAVSEQTAQDARDQRDCPLDRLHVIPNGIDLSGYRRDEERRRGVRQELGIPADSWTIVTVGRLVDLKNQALLLRAAEPLLAAGAHVVLVGDGPNREALTAQAKASAAPSHIHLTGLRSDVAAILSASDCFALTSTSEGLPLVVLEAMASELPVVSTDVGGIADVVQQGDTGLLVPSEDEDALREALAQLMHDRAGAAKMGNLGRGRALARYSSDRMIDDYLDYYERVRRS